MLLWPPAGSSLPPVLPEGDGAEWLNLTMDRFKVPVAYTSYVCKVRGGRVVLGAWVESCCWRIGGTVKS